MFSKTKSVTIGTATQLDETQLITPHALPPPRPLSTEKADDAAKPDAPPTNDGTSNADLIPWIKIK